MSDLRFVCCITSGQERAALRVASKRLSDAWCPFAIESFLTGPRKNRVREIRVTASMPYMLGQGTKRQILHWQESRYASGPIWFCTDRQWATLNRFRWATESQFRKSYNAWRLDERKFHCEFTPGQSVKIDGYLDDAGGRFLRMTEAGAYQLEVEMMNRVVNVTVPHHKVSAA